MTDICHGETLTDGRSTPASATEHLPSAQRSLLFLCHRIPFPPDKGEKIRAFRILEHLAPRFRISLGCFIDDPQDWAHTVSLEPYCAELKCIGLQPQFTKLRALGGLLTGAPLTVASFANAEMGEWVSKHLTREKPDVIFVYSSAMAQFVMERDLGQARLVMDFVDVDSDKWRQYAAESPPPMKWVYAREAKRLLAFDQAVAARADASLLVSDAEAALFRTLVPGSAEKTHGVANGIDCAYFSPEHRFTSPFSGSGPHFVFTGTMDYRPNIDAVVWFADEILPLIRASVPDATFTVVGNKPSRDVMALANREGIMVTGRVPDVRPYLSHATVVVAPLRIARGVQNKILEGMAMAKPVVTTPQGLEGIDAQPGEHLLLADTPKGLAAAALEATGEIGPVIGAAARRLMEASYAWPSRLGALDRILDRPS
jgi:sugar transferase (PEP-CTERM/EpsH1 system associated)